MPRHSAVFPSRFLPLALAAAVAFTASPNAQAYSLNGKSWPSGQVVLQLGLGNTPRALIDGSSSWNAAVAPALDLWNQRMGRVQLNGVITGSSSASSGDRVNSCVFSTTVFGQSFGRNTLAVTYYMTQGSSFVEADVLFNVAAVFDSYRGPLRFPAGGGVAIADIRRVFLHEVGHGIGLNHYEGDNVMAAMINDREVPSSDDTAGVQAIYGAPSNPTPTPPPPTPTPPPPTPSPTPTPPALASHLANISTRMRVGTGEKVLIGGFIVSGSQSKRLILRAIGPSLGATGVSGALSDPVLDLFDSAGNLVDYNDDWQAGEQAAAISATGVAPTNSAESALIATLPAGSYTAVVSGWDDEQGVALVEAYELDGTSTRMVNISTRGQIGTGDEALIGGLIVTGNSPKKVIVRAIGPSLASDVSGTLANPMLELRDGGGNLVAANDNWGTGSQVGEIVASGVPPSHALESAVVATLGAGSYTAVVRGVNDGTGLGLVEVFDLEP